MKTDLFKDHQKELQEIIRKWFTEKGILETGESVGFHNVAVSPKKVMVVKLIFDQPAMLASASQEDKFALPLEKLQSITARRILSRYVTLGELTRQTEAKILAIENFGPAKLEALKEQLEDLGVSLGMKHKRKHKELEVIWAQRPDFLFYGTHISFFSDSFGSIKELIVLGEAELLRRAKNFESHVISVAQREEGVQDVKSQLAKLGLELFP